MILSKGQRAALEQLENIASLIQIDGFHKLPVRPRTNTLVCGPSGMGKSFLARALADRLKLPILILNACSWIPVGARGDIYTWNIVVDFVQENPRGILFLDEIDKISSKTHDWLNSVRLEIHDFLDSVVPQSITVRTEDVDDDCLWDFGTSDKKSPKELLPDRAQVQFRLKYQYLIVAGGAWQGLWDELNASTMGFQKSSELLVAPDRSKLTSSITHELLRRFRDEIVIIPRMTKGDYIDLAKEVRESLPADIQGFFSDFCRAHMPDAVERNLGMRFFEEMVAKSFVQSHIEESQAEQLEASKFEKF